MWFFDCLFILTVKFPFKCDKTNPNYYLNLTVTPIEEEQNEKNIKTNNKCEEEFVFNDEKIKECESKLNLNSFKSKYFLAFLVFAFVRAIYKVSFLGTNSLYKDYYINELKGDRELDDNLKNYILFIPLGFLFIGAIFSFSKYYNTNTFLLIISIIAGIFGILAKNEKDKLRFGCILIGFHASSNLIIPLLIQKSFDCFGKDKQLAEIFYIINCLIYSCSDFFSFFESIKIYFLGVWINVLLILIYIIYIYLMKKKEEESKNKSNDKNELKIINTI